MAWYDEAVFYHIYPLGLTGAPKQNSYGEPVHRLNTLLPYCQILYPLKMRLVIICTTGYRVQNIYLQEVQNDMWRHWQMTCANIIAMWIYWDLVKRGNWKRYLIISE